MKDGELELNPHVPRDVWEFAETVGRDPFFLNTFDFVIDIAETPEGLKLVEVNAFETASFYAADLKTVYKIWTQGFGPSV
jgi:hypothetical protein